MRPGEISRSHCGVLFLDEFALFRTDVIEALRQPLESGDITVARQEESVTLPARCLLVLASNPCPCGNFSARAGDDRCQCLEQVRRAYQARISGPIIDRIDITRRVVGAGRAQRDPFGVETSAEVRARVAAARSRQVERFADRSWRLNGQIPGSRLKDTWPISAAAQRLVDDQCFQGRLSARGAVRVARLAWTVADLASVRLGRDVVPDVDEVGVALRLRAGDPLDLRIALSGQRAG